MRRIVPLSPLPLTAALSSVVLVAGLGAAVSFAPAGEPVVTAPLPSPQLVAQAPAAEPMPLAVQPPPPAAHDPADPATWSSQQLASQLVFSCVQASDPATAVDHARAGIGGITLLGKPTNRAVLTDALRHVRAAGPHGIAPLVASDEEGGKVQRLRRVLGPVPSAAAMGTWADGTIEETAFRYAAGMRSIGVQLALSPVADLIAAGGYPATRDRAFSADPGRAASAAVAWSRGLDRAGVLSAVKHWPGHGHARDTHTAAATAPPLAALEGRDLLPFDAVLRAGARVVMVGHLRSEGLTEPGVPATLSPQALRVLRARAGVWTVILTDDLAMAASSAALGITPSEAAVRALGAGADWAMSCVDPLGAARAVHAALDQGRLRRPALEASARRVLAVKERAGLLRRPVASREPVGVVTTATYDGTAVVLTGTAKDPDTPQLPDVELLLDGQVVGHVLPAPESGAFTGAVQARRGSQVCAVARNTGRGRSPTLGCVRVP